MWLISVSTSKASEGRPSVLGKLIGMDLGPEVEGRVASAARQIIELCKTNGVLA